MAEYDDTRYYDEYDDDRHYDRTRDYDDFDEADQALYDQMDEDHELVWRVQCHELAHALREHPLPGMPFSEEYRRRFHGMFPPFPSDPTVGELRNLFDDDAYEDAKKCAQSDEPDERWFGAKFLYWRNEALGRYCLNTNCLKRLPDRQRRRGRPQLYCNRECKDAAIKRTNYHQQHPNAAYRLKPMLIPGHPFSVRPDRNSITSGSYRPFVPAVGDRNAPWSEEDNEKRAADPPAEFSDHFRRLLSRHRKKRRAVTARERRNGLTAEQKRRRKEFERAFGAPLDEVIGLAVSDGYVFSDDDQAVFEALLGQSLHSIITGEDDHPDDDDGRPGTEPLPQD